jgi:hypothetical protein
VGSFLECGPGKTYRIQCYFNAAGYLADVVYRNTIPPTDVAICNAPQQHLQQADLTQLEISASDSIIRMVVCEDSNGVRGIAFNTALGERLQCGTVSQRCTPYSSRGTYPLGGFAGSCEAEGGRRWQRDRRTVLTRVFGACWNTQTPTRAAGAQMLATASGLKLFGWLCSLCAFGSCRCLIVYGTNGMCLPTVLLQTKGWQHHQPKQQTSQLHTSRAASAASRFRLFQSAALFGMSTQCLTAHHPFSPCHAVLCYAAANLLTSGLCCAAL